MWALIAATLCIAQAEDLTQDLAWTLSIGDTAVGERTLSVRYTPTEGGYRRVLEAKTEIDASAAGIPFTYRQRITAHAHDRPASFHSVVEDNGEPREIQGRLVSGGWMVTVVDQGRSRSWDLPSSKLQASTADLFDPMTNVPLTGFSELDMLSAETGEVWHLSVERLGPDTVEIAGVEVPVEGVAMMPPEGKWELWYTTDGVLVKQRYKWLGRTLEAKLKSPPPVGVDDAPVIVSGPEVEEVEL